MHDHEHHHDPAFDWNEVYSGELSDFEPPDPLLLALALEQPLGRVLDVGCGAGGLAAALAVRGFEVTGIDLSERAIRVARRIMADRGLTADLSVADATTFVPNAPFSLITNTFALPTKRADRAKVYAMMRNALAPGGVVLLKDFDGQMETHAPAFLGGVEALSVEELTGAFEGFEILRAEVVETPVHTHGHEPADGAPWTAALLHARKPG